MRAGWCTAAGRECAARGEVSAEAPQVPDPGFKEVDSWGKVVGEVRELVDTAGEPIDTVRARLGGP